VVFLDFDSPRPQLSASGAAGGLSRLGGAGPARRAIEVLAHEGGTGGFRSFETVVPETGAATVVLANGARPVVRVNERNNLPGSYIEGGRRRLGAPAAESFGRHPATRALDSLRPLAEVVDALAGLRGARQSAKTGLKARVASRLCPLDCERVAVGILEPGDLAAAGPG
jgi:hypothetical protein